jgi:hypothetical protein
MKEPTFQTRVLGHPAVVLPMAGVTLLMLYGCAIDVSAVPFALIAIALMARIMAANRALTDYKAWRREWDAMDGRPDGGAHWRIRLFVAVAIPAFFIASEAGYLAIEYRDLTAWAPWGLGVLLVAATAFAIHRALSRVSRRFRGRSKAFAVTPCNSRPLPVPDLRAAYRALPTHCHVAMGSLQ